MAFVAPEQKEKQFNSFLFLTEKSGVSYLVVFPDEKLTGREMLGRLKKDPAMITSGKVDVYMAAYKGAPLDAYTTGKYMSGGGTDLENYAAIKLQNRIGSVRYDTYKRYSVALTPAIGTQKDNSPILSESAYANLKKIKPVKIKNPDIELLVPRLTRTPKDIEKEKSLEVAVATIRPNPKTSYERKTVGPRAQEVAEQKIATGATDQKIARVMARSKEKAAQAAELERQKEAVKPVLAFKFAGQEYQIVGMTKAQFLADQTGSEEIFRQRLSRYAIRDEQGNTLDNIDRFALIYDLYHQKGGTLVFLKQKKKSGES